MQHKVVMKPRSDTPACQARLFHQLVKTFRAEMKLDGFDDQTAYVVLMDAVLRLAFEENGEAGVEKVMKLAAQLSEGYDEPALRVIG